MNVGQNQTTCASFHHNIINSDTNQVNQSTIQSLSSIPSLPSIPSLSSNISNISNTQTNVNFDGFESNCGININNVRNPHNLLNNNNNTICTYTHCTPHCKSIYNLQSNYNNNRNNGINQYSQLNNSLIDDDCSTLITNAVCEINMEYFGV